jgi:DNA-binding NarL/FixJ family response regulator/predicted regulator of Ras-like GTPase activity (Roadblock/LC7/MglB family)
MPVRILIADPDESFGVMLKQILELNDEYVADAHTSGSATLASAHKRKPDLLIVDAALADMSAAALIASMQLIRPGISIMLIPLGNTLPDEFQRLGVQGILTKPFFVGNLGKNIADVLGTETRTLVNLPSSYSRAIGSKPQGTSPTSKPPVSAAAIINKQAATSGEAKPSETAAPTPARPQQKPEPAAESNAPTSPIPSAKTVAPPASDKVTSERQTAPDRDKRPVPAPAKRATAPPSAASSLAKAAGNLAARIQRPSSSGPAEKPAGKPSSKPPDWVAALSKDTAGTDTAVQPVKPSVPTAPTQAEPKQPPTASAHVTEPPRSSTSAAPPESPRPPLATPRVRQAVPPPRRSAIEPEPARPAAPDPGDPQVAIERTLAALVRELRADALFVLRNGAPVFERGAVPGITVEAVAAVLRRWAEAATELAALVGENNGRFVQFHAEGERYHVYAFDTGKGLMLVVICRTDVPFGTLRLTLKSAGAELAKLVR